MRRGQIIHLQHFGRCIVYAHERLPARATVTILRRLADGRWFALHPRYGIAPAGAERAARETFR